MIHTSLTTQQASLHSKAIVFFDGPCSFCNRFVKFIFRNDKKDLFRYSSLDSSFAASNLEHNDYSTLIVKYNEKIYMRSLAILFIFSNLRFPYNLFKIFKIFPVKVLDLIYKLVSKYRRYLPVRTCSIKDNVVMQAKILQ